tara:strand:- start:2848 stop:3093 length:246 start_codon:yes stop_codon:yes gene_type:complete
MNRITMAEASEMSSNDIESLMIEKGDETTNDDIDNFIKFICTKAEQRGLVIRKKENGNGNKQVDRDRKRDVKYDGMEESNR